MYELISIYITCTMNEKNNIFVKNAVYFYNFYLIPFDLTDLKNKGLLFKKKKKKLHIIHFKVYYNMY